MVGYREREGLVTVSHGRRQWFLRKQHNLRPVMTATPHAYRPCPPGNNMTHKVLYNLQHGETPGLQTKQTQHLRGLAGTWAQRPAILTSKWLVASLHTSNLSDKCYMFHPSNPTWFDHLKNIRWRVHIIIDAPIFWQPKHLSSYQIFKICSTSTMRHL
jgi:hypothetical protein